MDVLSAVTVELPCSQCGTRYRLTLERIRITQALAHEGCPITHQKDCVPIFHSQLFGKHLLDDLRTIWQRLEETAAAVGGTITLGEKESC